MFELIKKGLMAGLGAGVISHELVAEATGQLVEEGRLTKEEARALADKLVESGRLRWEEVEREAREALQRTAEALDLANKQDLNRLIRRLEKLEKKVERLEPKPEPEAVVRGGEENNG